MDINVVKMGVVKYNDALEIQKKLRLKRQNGEIKNTLLLLEHFPTLTLGVRGNTDNIYLSSEELEKNDVEVFEVDRGGDVTYHGLGQIVGYVIFDLNDFGKDIKLFLSNIEQSIINLLNNEFGINAYSDKGKYTGVWVDDKKITAMGISVSRAVTMHGFAFNVNTSLEHFGWINPCGLGKGVTSVAEITGEKQDMDKMYLLVQKYFEKQFDCKGISAKIEQLI